MCKQLSHMTDKLFSLNYLISPAEMLDYVLLCLLKELCLRTFEIQRNMMRLRTRKLVGNVDKSFILNIILTTISHEKWFWKWLRHCPLLQPLRQGTSLTFLLPVFVHRSTGWKRLTLALSTCSRRCLSSSRTRTLSTSWCGSSRTSPQSPTSMNCSTSPAGQAWACVAICREPQGRAHQQ